MHLCMLEFCLYTLGFRCNFLRVCLVIGKENRKESKVHNSKENREYVVFCHSWYGLFSLISLREGRLRLGVL